MEKVSANNYREGSSYQYAIGLGALKHLSLKGHERVLDLGCADGRLTAKIAEQLSSGEVTGVDISSDMIEFAQRSFPHIRFIKQDASSLSLEGGYDLITAQLLVHFFRNKETLLRSWRMALKPGGYLLLTAVPSESPYQQLLKRLFYQPKWHPYYHSNLWYFTSLVDYIAAGENSGFELHLVELKSRFFEPENQEALKKSIVGVLPMIASIPDHLVEAFLADLVNEVEPWYLPGAGGYKIPLKTLTLILKR